MTVILLIDTPPSRLTMYPLSLTRPICDLRHGILTIREWWIAMSQMPVFALTEFYLQEAVPEGTFFICIDATVKPDAKCFGQVLALQPGTMLEDERGLIAFATTNLPVYNQLPVWTDHSVQVPHQERLEHVWQLFQTNEGKIRQHFQLLTNGKTTAPVAESNIVIGGTNLFLEAGVEMEACTINASTGPVYIGKNALIMEGALIRGPVSIGEGAVIKMGTKLYPGTTIGPYCTAGGEIKNAILTGYSNKAHDGYLGDSVVGEWCNFGAGFSNSNVKNTGGEVKMWDEPSKSFQPAGMKAGVVMGDYSRCAINSSFNTGTTIGVSCNIFDGTYPDKHLSSFSWGNYERYEFQKACTDAANWKKMKGKEFSAEDRLILQYLFEMTNNR